MRLPDLIMKDLQILHNYCDQGNTETQRISTNCIVWRTELTLQRHTVERQKGWSFFINLLGMRRDQVGFPGYGCVTVAIGFILP